MKSTLPSQLTSPFTITIYFVVLFNLISLPVLNFPAEVNFANVGVTPNSFSLFIFAFNSSTVYVGETFTYLTPFFCITVKSLNSISGSFISSCELTTVNTKAFSSVTFPALSSAFAYNVYVPAVAGVYVIL